MIAKAVATGQLNSSEDAAKRADRPIGAPGRSVRRVRADLDGLRRFIEDQCYFVFP